MNKELVLITGSYPYSFSGENTFLPQEIEVYKKYFKKITIVPKNISGTKLDNLESNLVINIDYAININKKYRKYLNLFSIFFDLVFFKEIIESRKILITSPIVLIRIIKSRIYTKISSNWFENNFYKNDNIIFLTWWFDETTNGIAESNLLVKPKVFTRAHGYDLYYERHSFLYIPFRKSIIKKGLKVFPDSHFGVKYLQNLFPENFSNIKPGILGIDDYNFVNFRSNSTEFKILSCSFLNDIKRVPLILESIIELSKINNQIKISWTHIGDGPDKFKYIKIANSVKSDNLEIEFLDYPGKNGLINYYKNNSIDLFINLSLSEGTPIAIMEAICAGIPILATDVGGNKEIVTINNGILISTFLNSLEISKELNLIINDRINLNTKRMESRKHWEINYNAKINYDNFCKLILE